jgi:hypothetical protein
MSGGPMMNTLVQNEAQRERFSGEKGIGMTGCLLAAARISRRRLREEDQ